MFWLVWTRVTHFYRQNSPRELFGKLSIAVKGCTLARG